MCLISFAWQSDPAFPLILVANRDEYYARPSLAADTWAEDPEIIGGRDLLADGSWLAASRKGRFAAVTNFREGIPEPAPASRGQLVKAFLQSTSSPAAFNSQLDPGKHSFGGYNLLLGTENQLFYSSNRSDLATTLNPGVYSLSNHLLDTPWPKAVYAKQQLAALLEESAATPTALIAMMQQSQPYQDALLPATGIGIEKERTLSPPFIHSEDYGTRCTTVVRWHKDRVIELIEQSYRNDGSAGELTEHLIRLE